ncbi:helix-turn-helix transcriptional regulator [Micromonospora sp. KC213]|uniref:helix-turn-helix domain-containing protein n=1 Tax=Micromonospora sp. KC213 TaxID=2530378 RepID=UPI00104AE478|nr:helix-turn-helix transcriptional regulator [Micromonospora sp. KC213]TDC36952.1 XRE family transcriptional regulator [Micromonospora sp. KC213]
MGSSTQDDAAAAFVQELTHWRHQRRLSKKELAERTGFDPSYVSHIENGRHQPTEEFARRAELALDSGNRIWQRYVAFAGTRPVAGRPPVLGPTAVPPPTGPHLVIDDEQADLALVDGAYECRFRRVLHSVGTEPITRHTVQIDIDRFPDDPARSTAFHSRHPLTLDEVDFRAYLGVDRPEPMRWRVTRSRDAFLKITLPLEIGGAPAPLYPGQRTVVDYAYRVPAWKFGDWLQRDIRLPTRRLTVRLAFPAAARPTVWASETSFTSETTADVTPRRQERAGVVAYEWEVPRPRLRAQYRVHWRYGDPSALVGVDVPGQSPGAGPDDPATGC